MVMNDGGRVVLGQACVFVLMVERLMVTAAVVACSGVTGRCTGKKGFIRFLAGVWEPVGISSWC